MILVTGGSGLLGSELIKQLLSNGSSVRAIYNQTPLTDFHFPPVQQFQCNILDTTGLEEAMQDIKQVYHCAAIVSFNPSRKHELFKVNFEGTANVVNTAIACGIKKLVHVSSVSALGRLRENEPVNEGMHWTEESSNSNYGQSKYLGELEVWRGIGEGLDAVIINPAIILGEGDWNAGSSQIFKSVYNEFPWYTDGVSGFVDVRDVAGAMIALMESDISGERFIVSAENRNYRDIFNLISKAFGKKPPGKKVTSLIAGFVWRREYIKYILTGKNPLVTKETAATALAKVYFENNKLLNFLPGFRYRPLEETIADTCRLMQQKLNNH